MLFGGIFSYQANFVTGFVGRAPQRDGARHVLMRQNHNVYN